MVEPLLFGRDREMRTIEEHIESANQRGSALLIRGEPGVGKSSILDAAKNVAAARGLSVLSATGVQSEANLPFSGLFELLRPILSRIEHLAGPHQNALKGAFGLGEAAAADLFLIALGALNVLADFAAERPLLLVIDDAQWLDPSSVDVLAFIARRLESEPIFLLIAGRDMPETSLEPIVSSLRIKGLDDAAARALLKALYPDLHPGHRQRVLEESAGNPLAIVELPKAIEQEYAAGGLLPAALPLTTRLERSFATRIAELPSFTRALLLIAALNEESSLADVVSAARIVNGAEEALSALTPAVSTGLIQIDTAELRFRHPLVRSALYHASNFAERVAAHSALATVLSDPDRRTWHRAAATVGLDETVAEDLQTAAVRAQQRGDIRTAIQALDRAAQLSTDRARAAQCLLQAAELALEIGWARIANDLLDRAERLDVSPRDRMKLKFFREATARTVSGGQALVEIADTITTEGDADLALDILAGPAVRSWWAEPDQEVCDRLIAAVDRVCTDAANDPRFLLVLAMTAPIDRGGFVIEHLRRWSPTFSDDPRTGQLLGIIANQAGDFELSQRFLGRPEALLRNDGRLALLTHILVFRAWNAIYLGNRDVAVAAAEEGERLARETDQPIYTAGALAAEALLASVRGDEEAAEALANEAERTTQPLGTLMAEVQMARGMNALAAGRYDDAFRQFHRMFDATDSANHPMKHCFYIGDLTEAALQSGHRTTVEAILVEMEQFAERTPSPLFHASMHYARALLADDADAERLFKTALASEVVSFPFLHARVRLAFGSWLRRTRRSREARAFFERAVETFDALGASPWSERTRQELRASGVASKQRVPERKELLTPQELQIALMASEGLSNQEIGLKLYLSHRTVGSHLYRIFPKLGITSRYQLRDVLVSRV